MIIHDKIGEGSYGCVYKVEKKSKLYAMKKLNINNLKNYEKRCIISELKILSCHSSNHIISYFYSEIVGNYLCIYTEYIDGGDLTQLIKKHITNNTSVNPEHTQKYIIQLSSALHYLHQNNIIHRDIKPSNVLLTKDNNIKLIDFGISKICDKYLKYTKTFVGTPYYIAPEQFRNINYNYKVDIWGVGCLLYEICEHHVPFLGKDMYSLRHNVLNGSVHFKKTPRIFRPIIQRCLSKTPYGRPELMWIKKQFNNSETSILPKINICQVIIPYKNFDWNKFIESLPNRLESPIEEISTDVEELLNMPKQQLIKMIYNLRKELNDIKNK